jgi:hypothetical protein
MLNLLDLAVEVDLPRGLFDAGLGFVHEALQTGGPVLVHCEQGLSRSASIGLLYLRRHTNRVPPGDYGEAEEWYLGVYPPYRPGAAIRHFLRRHWDEYAPL